MAEAEFSCGGVVVDRSGSVASCVVIVPTRRAADGPEDAALREVREETGLEARVVAPLGDVRYIYQRSGRRIAKVVRFFLMEATGGSFDDHDHEVEVVRWVPLAEAASTLSYPGEREMVQRAMAALGSG
jgi:8-oxo-dGTP pyrophosphatase MutT (NUDIX family)